MSSKACCQILKVLSARKRTSNIEILELIDQACGKGALFSLPPNCIGSCMMRRPAVDDPRTACYNTTNSSICAKFI
jgi:hypothetical protein